MSLRGSALNVAIQALLATFVFVALGAFDADAAGPSPLASPPSLLLTVGGALAAPPVAPGFVGISFEYSAISTYAANAQLTRVLAELIANLAPGQTPILRFGGDSTDWTQVAVPGKPLPPGVSFVLTPQYMQTLGAVVRVTRAKAILGLNLEDDNPQLAAAEADALSAAVGRSSVLAFEIGNEPELYAHLAWYTTQAGVNVLGRTFGYDVSSYLSEYKEYISALPAVPLAGPATGGADWMAALAPFVATAPRLGLVTIHLYPLQRCFTRQVSNVYPTIAHLLARSASDGLAARAASNVAEARARGVPLRVDELNSVSCEGQPGVSDTFASALWALDTMFAMAREGVAGVNVHTLPGADYQPFEVTQGPGHTSQYEVNPMYYGLLAFADAVPPGSRLMSLTGPLAEQVRGWAVRTPNGQTRVVLINEGTSPEPVSVAAPSGTGLADLTWLLAPSLTSTSGVTLDGQSFGQATTTGQLAGQPVLDQVAAVSGAYTLQLPAGSAVILSAEQGY